MDETAKRLHDSLLAEKPEDASHDSSACAFCRDEGGPSVKTFTEEEAQALVASAVASATAELKTKVSELEGAATSSEIDAKVTAAKAEAEAKAAELQTALDAKEIERVAEKERADALEAANVAAEKKAEADARKKDRMAKAKEAAGFSDEWLETNGDRLAAKTDEEFAADLEGWAETRAAALAAANVDPSKVPATTALTATRESDKPASTSPGALLREVATFRDDGIDIRRVG